MVDSSGTTAAGHRIRVEHRCCQYRHDISMGQAVAGVAADSGQLLAAMIFMNVSSDHEDIADADFEALVRSIRFAGDPEGGLTPASGDGGLEGVYTHLDFGLMPNVFGGMDFQSESEDRHVRSRRTVQHKHPTGGLASPAIARRCRGSAALPASRRAGSAGPTRSRCARSWTTTAWSRPRGSFARDGQNLKIDGGDYFRLPPSAEGTTFDGTWTYTWASSGMTTTSSGSVTTQRALRLYTRTGASAAAAGPAAAAPTASPYPRTARPARGRTRSPATR